MPTLTDSGPDFGEQSVNFKVAGLGDVPDVDLTLSAQTPAPTRTTRVVASHPSAGMSPGIRWRTT